MEKTALEMHNISLVGGPGFVFRLIFSWDNGYVGGDETTALFVASQDGKRYHQISGLAQNLPEVEDAIANFLDGNETYGNPDKFGVHAYIINRHEWIKVCLPNLEQDYWLAHVTSTLGSGNPKHWLRTVELFNPSTFVGNVKKMSKGSKLNITVDGQKVSNLKEARQMLVSGNHKKLIIEFKKYSDYHKVLQKPIYDHITIKIDLP